jgi:hypothetical protein
MKIILCKAEDNSDAKTGVILRALEHFVCRYEGVLPNGWRFIIKMQIDGDTEPYYHLDVQSNKGGGNFAEVKMATLEAEGVAASGAVDLARLVEIVESAEGDTPDKRRVLKALSELEDVGQASKELWRTIRDSYNVTAYHGAVRIPYEDLIAEGGAVTEEHGEIRISFSGASQEQDLFFALSVFRELNASFGKLYPNTQGWINLRALKQIPMVDFWINALGIEEA